MKKYLITHDATVGRTKADGANLPPVSLVFYSMVDAESSDAASDKVVNYSDPGFISKVSNIAEMGEGMTAGELFTLLDHKKVVIESTV